MTSAPSFNALPTATASYFSALAEFLRLSVTPVPSAASSIQTHRRLLGALCGSGLASVVVGSAPIALTIGGIIGYGLGLAADCAGATTSIAVSNAFESMGQGHKDLLIKGTITLVNLISAFVAMRGEAMNFVSLAATGGGGK